ncbi:Y-family DNA polymerase [Vibrio sp. SS-MA-C1-2]|uniref:Y-family DNA polymerase n=1 Tax=Vibrio sp. SS-MA-C1-2 TaxID=2908646 RepID=UPI001F21183E|nr:Y-family DNA polymerase [Vibrio sp. SS-MA-C1-2]UJF17729.1 Y-family DNA polymerase [Vibrio sp. SS-MA-C1-2]
MFALVDANAFYASAEAVFRPDIRHKGIVVLSNNDGVVVAANRKAQEVVPKFTPFFKVRHLCQQHNIEVFSSNYPLYADLSAKMMEVIGQFAPEQYIYSIDETFLSFNDCQQTDNEYLQLGSEIRLNVWKKCRLPVCVGMAKTLTLAKLANRLAKKQRQQQGVCLFNSAEVIEQALAITPIDDVWGIGRRLTQRLNVLGIKTALDLTRYPFDRIKAEFNRTLCETVRELKGEACIHWHAVEEENRQIFSTRTLGQPVFCLDDLQQALIKHSQIAANKLRKKKQCAEALVIFAGDIAFDRPNVRLQALYQFAQPTADSLIISQAVSKLVPQLFRPEVKYQKVGVGLIGLVKEQHVQSDLFIPDDNRSLMTALDGLNQKYGQNTLFIAGQGIEQKWAMRQQYLSPHFTTNWKDIPIIYS